MFRFMQQGPDPIYILYICCWIPSVSPTQWRGCNGIHAMQRGWNKKDSTVGILLWHISVSLDTGMSRAQAMQRGLFGNTAQHKAQSFEKFIPVFLLLCIGLSQGRAPRQQSLPNAIPLYVVLQTVVSFQSLQSNISRCLQYFLHAGTHCIASEGNKFLKAQSYSNIYIHFMEIPYKFLQIIIKLIAAIPFPVFICCKSSYTYRADFHSMSIPRGSHS